MDIGAFEVQVAALPSADFDTDNDIDGKDFLSWQRGYGTTVPNGTIQDGDANNDLGVDAQGLGIWQEQFGTTPVAAVASETSTLSGTSRTFLGEVDSAIVMLALGGNISQPTEIFDHQPARVVEELVSDPLPVPLTGKYADYNQDNEPDRQESANDEAFSALTADDLSMGRLALNLSWQ